MPDAYPRLPPPPLRIGLTGLFHPPPPPAQDTRVKHSRIICYNRAWTSYLWKSFARYCGTPRSQNPWQDSQFSRWNQHLESTSSEHTVTAEQGLRLTRKKSKSIVWNSPFLRITSKIDSTIHPSQWFRWDAGMLYHKRYQQGRVDVTRKKKKRFS